MQQAIRGHRFAAVEFKWRSIETSHFAASLFHDQHARCRVPGIEIKLPEAVEAPGSYVAQIERSRARPAHSVRVQRDLVIEVNIRILVPLVTRETRGQEAFLERSGFRDVNRFPHSAARLFPAPR